MKLLKFLPLLLIPILFYQCQREINHVDQIADPVIVSPEPISAKLQGNVYDENDQPAQGVTVTVGSQTAQTDSKGYFRFESASLDKKSALVTAEKTGYFKAYRTFGATSGTNQVVIKLIKKALAGTIDANTGGSVTLSNGSKISLPANGVVKSSTNISYSGTINVYAAYIDPTSGDINVTVPGSFLANDKNGSRVTLASYGMMAVELESTTAEKLQIKEGTVATLTMAIPSSRLSSATPNIPLWFVKEQTGIWQEEGSAKKQGNFYVGEVKHFTYWNCDIQLPSVNITGTIVNAAGQPLPYIWLSATLTTSTVYGSAHGQTDAIGQFSGAVPANQNLVLNICAPYPCYTVMYSINIGPFSQNANLGTITIPAFVSQIGSVSGHLNNCNGGNVTNGYAVLVHNNQVQFASTDANGDFVSPWTFCPGAPNTMQIFGVDLSSQQQGTPVAVTLTGNTTNAGTFSACGAASSQFMNYTLDGTSFNMTDNSIIDSLQMWTTLGGGGMYYTNFSCHRLAPSGAQISFIFSHTALVTGSYPIYQLRAQQYNTFSNTIIPPFDITLTSFPQSVGQFYEGSFSGQFKDPQNVTHTITNGSFKIRKNF